MDYESKQLTATILFHQEWIKLDKSIPIDLRNMQAQINAIKAVNLMHFLQHDTIQQVTIHICNLNNNGKIN